MYNWTVDEVVDWLEAYVELPQYVEAFRKMTFNGTSMPRYDLARLTHTSHFSRSASFQLIKQN